MVVSTRFLFFTSSHDNQHDLAHLHLFRLVTGIIIVGYPSTDSDKTCRA